MYYPEPISKLVDSFTKLPGIGPKTAVRLAFSCYRWKKMMCWSLGKHSSMRNVS